MPHLTTGVARLTAGPRRRAFLAGTLGAALLARAHAFADPVTLAEVPPLISAAVKVKDLDSVYLVAIERAGDRLVAAGEHGVIIYSDDHGANWTQADMPVSVTITCLAFATPQIGWAAGHFGVILNSMDGGKSWTRQLDGLQLNQIALASAQEAVSAPDAAANASPAMTYALKRANLFMQDGPDKPFLTMLLLGPQKLLALGAYRIAMLTEDGGKSWQDCSLRFYDKLSHDLYDATLSGGDIYVAAETGIVFRSTDDAATFPQVTPPAQATLFGVVGAKDGSIITFGVAGNGFRSTDGGQSWAPVNFGTSDDLVVGRVLVSGTVLVAAESGAVLMSKDNGVSFTPLPGMPPISISSMVQAADGSLVFATGGGPRKVSVPVLNG